jgi:TrmH family RNA methyltransferase
MITSRTNESIKRYRGLLIKPEPGFVCLEGLKLISDSIKAGAKVLELFISPKGEAARGGTGIRYATIGSGGKVWEADDEILDYMCDTEHPQGVAAIAAWEPRTEIVPGSHVLALDGVQDPGNVGTMIRTAAAFGFEAVILGGDTARANSPKVARSSAGAIFKINVLQLKNLEGALSGLKECGFKIIALDMGGEPIVKAEPSSSYCLVVGSEGNGLSRSVKAISDVLLSIPMRGAIESLNASVAMWELAGRS